MAQKEKRERGQSTTVCLDKYRRHLVPTYPEIPAAQNPVQRMVLISVQYLVLVLKTHKLLHLQLPREERKEI